jgi:hypothetical protein
LDGSKMIISIWCRRSAGAPDVLFPTNTIISISITINILEYCTYTYYISFRFNDVSVLLHYK